MNSKNLSEVFLTKEKQNSKLGPDLCYCSECEGTFKVSECHHDYDHHDGWEMPAYTEVHCPKCDDGGCVDDFFFSGDKNE